MYETASDLEALETLLEESYRRAGPHLREVITPERRPSAHELCERLSGMRLLVLATVSADGRPFGGPVDGIFYRGAFHFGTSPDALRARHLRRVPYVSATHLPAEEFSVTVHGRAVPVDLRDPVHRELRQTIVGIYAPRFGAEWERDFLDAGPVYFRIEADRLFSFFWPVGGNGPG